MKSPALRLYVLSVTLLVFFVLWAVIAAKPWAASSGPDPRLAALAARERQIRHEARVVEKIVHRRWVAYRRRLRAREAQIHAREKRHAQQLAAAHAAAVSTVSYSAAPSSQVVTLAPQVSVVTLPPVTSSGSSHP